MYGETTEVKVNSTLTLPFGTLSWIVWVVFMILYYGTGTIAHWPVFWIWFPFWLPFALGGAAIVFGLTAVGIINRLDK